VYKLHMVKQSMSTTSYYFVFMIHEKVCIYICYKSGLM